MQISGNSSALGRDDCAVRDVVRTLEEQLVKERAKNHRTVNKRCQEQRHLLEQVHLFASNSKIYTNIKLKLCPLLLSWFYFFSLCPGQLEELRASENALRFRVKSLTSELELLRRGLDNLSVYYIFTLSLFHSFNYNLERLSQTPIYLLCAHFLCVCSRVTPLSGRISSRVEGEIYRSLSRERRSGYGTLRARSGSRERTEDRRQRSEERGRRADSSGPRARIPRPSPSPTGTGSAYDIAVV